MDKTIIARLVDKNGFVREEVIPEIKPDFEIVVLPPITAYKNVETNDYNFDNTIRKRFIPVSQTIIVDYKEI